MAVGSSARTACPNSVQASLRHSQSWAGPPSASLAGCPQDGQSGGVLAVAMFYRRGRGNVGPRSVDLTAAACGAILGPSDSRDREERAMVARVSTYRGGSDKLLDGFRRTTEALAQLDGFERAYFLTDAESGRSMTMTVWASQAAMDASAEWAEKAREHAAHDSGAVVESVTGFEVALTAEKPLLR
jgi:heme-degrading monooxygenase HmoA